MATEPTPFIVLDLTHLLAERGLAMAGVPYRFACDGNPTGGTYTRQPGELTFVISSSCVEDEPIWLQRIALNRGCNCFYKNDDGNWVRWNPPAGLLDFTQPDWAGWTAIRVEGDDFLTDWIDSEGHTWSAGRSH